VAALVHRREHRADLVLRVPRREADVTEPERDLERVHGGVEPKLIPRGSEPLDELA
jgi:hypothetical protein